MVAKFRCSENGVAKRWDSDKKMGYGVVMRFWAWKCGGMATLSHSLGCVLYWGMGWSGVWWRWWDGVVYGDVWRRGVMYVSHTMSPGMVKLI